MDETKSPVDEEYDAFWEAAEARQAAEDNAPGEPWGLARFEGLCWSIIGVAAIIGPGIIGEWWYVFITLAALAVGAALVQALRHEG